MFPPVLNIIPISAQRYHALLTKSVGYILTHTALQPAVLWCQHAPRQKPPGRPRHTGIEQSSTRHQHSCPSAMDLSSFQHEVGCSTTTCSVMTSRHLPRCTTADYQAQRTTRGLPIFHKNSSFPAHQLRISAAFRTKWTTLQPTGVSRHHMTTTVKTGWGLKLIFNHKAAFQSKASSSSSSTTMLTCAQKRTSSQLSLPHGTIN